MVAEVNIINAKSFPWLKSANRQYKNTGTNKIRVDVSKLGIHLYIIFKNVFLPAHQWIELRLLHQHIQGVPQQVILWPIGSF